MSLLDLPNYFALLDVYLSLLHSNYCFKKNVKKEMTRNPQNSKLRTTSVSKLYRFNGVYWINITNHKYTI